MQRLKKILLILLIIYFIYLYIFGVLIFKVYQYEKPSYSYDISSFTQSTEEEAYAFLVEDRQFALAVRIALINQAEETIDVSYYTMHDGKARDIFFGALVLAANRGVKIRVIVDGLMNMKMFGDKKFKALNATKNIEIKYYEPLNILLPFTINNTLHDKLLIIDEKYGLIGGRNIEDRMFIKYDNPQKETYDRDVIIYGGDNNYAVMQMKEYYNELFNHKYSKNNVQYQTDEIKKVREQLKNQYLLYNQDNDFSEIINTISNEGIKIEKATFLHSPFTRLNKYPIIFLALTELAEIYDEIFIQSPYLIINQEMREMIPNIENKKITILTNNLDYNPNFLALSGYIRYREELSKKTNLYEIQTKSSIHAKTIVFGDEITIIGSFNFDPRSTFLSTESMMVIYSKEFTRHLKAKLSNYLEESLEVGDDGKYISDEEVSQVPKRTFKRILIRIISIITYFHDELL